MSTSVFLKAETVFRGLLPKEIATNRDYHPETINSGPVHLLLQSNGSLSLDVTCVAGTLMEKGTIRYSITGKYERRLFLLMWQREFTAFLHSWGQECFHGGDIVTYDRGKKGNREGNMIS